MLWMTDEIQRRLLLTLAHFLWQASAVMLVLIALTTVFRIRQPTARYAVSLLAFAVMAASPIATWLLMPIEPLPASSTTVPAPAIIDVPPPSEVMPVASAPILMPDSADSASAAIGIEPVPEATRPLPLDGMHRTAGPPPVRTWREVLRIAEPYIIGVWQAGVCVLSLRLLLGALGIRRWRRSGQVPADELLAVLKRISDALGMATPLVRISGQVGEAVAVGLLRPMILLPASWLTELPPDMLEAVLAHELAHLRRLDLWVNLMQRIVETLLFYHPAVWWLSRRLRNERELCCDALAVEVTRDPLRYAETLEHVARLNQTTEASRLALAFHAGEGTLMHRIRQLLEPVPPAVSGMAWLAGCMTLILALAIPVSAFVALRSNQHPASEENSAAVDDAGEGKAPAAAPATAQDPVEAELSDWPQWGRGPLRNNVANATVPALWDLERGTNVAWTAKLGTATYSSPVVAGGKVFIGTSNGAALNPAHPASQDLACLVCFDQATGKLLWQYASGKLPSGRVHDWPNIGLCSTACIHGDRVWVVTNRCEVVCLDVSGFRDGENDGPFRSEPAQTELDGDVVWKFDVFGELGVRPLHQAVSSIVHVDGVLLLNTSNGPDESHQKVPAPQAPNFLALDAATGRVLWTDNSAGESIIVGGSSCSCSGTSPAVATIHGVRQAIFAGKEGWVYGYRFDDLKQGRTSRLWQFDCNPKTSRYMLGGRGRRNTVIASPVVWNNHVYVATGRNPEQADGEADLWCIDPSKRGDISSELVFNKSFQNGEKPIPHKPYCACEEDQGDFTRPNPNSGAVWHYSSQDRDGDGKTGFEETFHRSLSNPVIHNGLLLIADTSGLLHCLDAKQSVNGQPVVHWTHDLMAACWSTPLIADGRVYVGDEDGDVAVFELSAQKKLLAENMLDAPVYATPCAVGKTLFVASMNQLVALGDRLEVSSETSDAELQWGPVTNGLRARVVPVPAAMSEDDSDHATNSSHAGAGVAIPESDPFAKYGDQLVVSWVHAGDHRSPEETVRVIVLKDGTVRAAGDTNRNRDCEIKLTAAQLEQLLKELDETDQCFDLLPDGQHFIRPGAPYNRWDRSADWVHIRRVRKEVRIGCIYGWVSGTGEQVPGVVIHRNVLTRLNSLINVTRAGGWDEIERLVPIANQALQQTFPQLPPLIARDFSSSERFFYSARSIYFRQQRPDGKHFGVELELRDDGTVNLVSAWFGEDVRDLDRPPVVRGLDLSKVPVTKEWKEMQKLRVLTDQGYAFKPEYESHEVGPELWLCYLPQEKKFFVEHSSNQRRKLYGPIAGDPYAMLNPPPVRQPRNIEKADSKQTSGQTLSALVQSFNVENRQLARGLDQPPLTDDEVIAVIQRGQWKPELQPLNGEEIAAFKDVGRTGLLPKDAYLQVYDDEQPEPFRVRHLWQIRLMLPAIGHDGFVGLTIRDTLVREETIEPSAVAWGEPDADGLQLGAYLTPKKDRYAVGERVRLRLLVCNHGSQPVKTTWPNTSHPMPDDFRVTDETGAGVAVRIGHRSWDLPWISGYVTGGLAPGEIHTLRVPYEISLGGDGAQNKLIGRVIDAKPGQKLKLKVRQHSGSERAKDSGATVAESGVIELMMHADQPVVSDVDPNGEIHGRLVDEQGQPVAGAVIACGAVINDSGQGGGVNTITDANGRYRLKVPSPGIYNVWLKRHESPQMTAVSDDGLPVQGGKVTASQMMLIAGVSISGTLVDARDRPLPSESVYCYSRARPQSGATVMSTTTNDKGVFTFTLPPGRAFVYASKPVPESAGILASGSVHADVVINVPMPGETPDQQEPLKLKLLARGVPFGSDEWVRRSTPGTQVIRHENAADVTGTVVDTDGQPVPGAQVFRYDGPIIAVSEEGGFKVTAPKGTQFILHAFAPGYHVWFGTPTAGDVLRIVLEKKSIGPIVRSVTHVEDAHQSDGDPGLSSFDIRLVGGPEREPLNDVLVKITQGYGSQQKVFGPHTTQADGTLRCTLPPGDFDLHLRSDREWPYLPVDAAWDKAPRGPVPALHVRLTATGPEKWVRERKQLDGVEPAKNGSPAQVTFTLLPATELILRAVDAETGQGLAGAEFYQENAVGEDWAHAIFSHNLGSKFGRESKLSADALRTDRDGRFRRLVSANAGFRYGVAKPPAGYEAVAPGREIELPIVYGQLRAEHAFQFRRVAPLRQAL